MQSPLIRDVTTATFNQEVIEASKDIPVVVDFWAPWCGPCRALGPVLEKLAVEYGGRFRLVKVNSDENQELSQQYNIRSIPDVRAFRDGREAGQFMGALPERQVRAFIEKMAPSAAEAARARASELRASGDAAGALAALERAVTLDSAHQLARVDLADALVEVGRHEEAARQLETVEPNAEWDVRIVALKQAIAFARSGGSESALVAKVAASPADLESRLALAGAFAARKAWPEAMDQLLEIIGRDRAHAEARKQLLALFSLAAGDAALVSAYRRKLASVLN